MPTSAEIWEFNFYNEHGVDGCIIINKTFETRTFYIILQN